MILSCDYGMITVNPMMTKFGFVPEKKSLERLHYDFDDSCTNYINIMYSLQPCRGKNKCRVAIGTNWLRIEDPTCKSTFEDSEFKTVLGLHCKHLVLPTSPEESESIIKIYITNFGLFATVFIFSFYYLFS